MNVIATPQDQANEIALAEHAAVIRALGKRVVSDILEIGRRLVDVRDNHCKRGEWLPWLEREFDWDRSTADNYINVFDAFGKLGTVPNLNMSMRGLYLLAAPKTPEEARAEVIARAESGEALSLADVQRIVDEANVKQHDKTIADLRAEAKAREDAVRAEYANKLVLDPDKLREELGAAIAKAVEPYKKQLAAAEKKLEAAAKRLEKKEAAEPRPQGPKIDSNVSLASTVIQMAISTLAGKLAITPQQMVEIETLSATATSQTLADRLGKSRAEAAEIVNWLNGFISIAL